jgi:predicted transcriptional regulator
MKDVRVAMALNEKLAGVCLPDLNGRADFSAGFSGNDERFMKWCRDLFEHCWTKATTRPPIQQQYCGFNSGVEER